MPTGLAPKSRALIDTCREILATIHPASIRAVCYQLFIQGLLPSMAKKHTNRVSHFLVRARKEGVIPWYWIVDETRDAERQATWASADQYVRSLLRYYRKDRWLQQPTLVEVWSEKGTIRGTLAPVLRQFGVTFRVIHGHTSWTQSHDAFGDFVAADKPCVVLYVGDHDPSGRHMSDVDLPENRFRWEEDHAHDPAGVPAITLTRLAIDPTDPAQAALPSFPASDKQADSRYRWFVDRYGTTCWELDAMNPNDLRTLVQQAIEAQIDWDAWLRAEEVEAAENRSMRDFLAQWTALHPGKTGQAR